MDIMGSKNVQVSIVKNDITLLPVDVIVNAANNSLLGGGGVDGAIHRAAGPELLNVCRSLGGCETGQAKITEGYNLRAKYIIHTVGPVWKGGNFNESELLSRCYRNSLKLADAYKLEQIAFPSISTGVYGFPLEKACKIALDTIGLYLHSNKHLLKIYLVCFSSYDYQIYNSIYKNHRLNPR
jgi:O-acetyl-ADP-ribose deacetylase (regulator of RNase III)